MTVVVCTAVEPEGRDLLMALEDEAGVDEVVVTEGSLPGDPADLPALARAGVLCVAVHDRVDEGVLDAAPDLRLVVTRSTGIDNVDVEACKARGVDARHLPEYASEAVLEMAVTAITLLLRRAPEGFRRALDDGAWDRTDLLARRLSDVTVGVVGVGRIGRRVARACAAAGASVLGYDVAPDPTFQPPGFAWMTSLDQVLPRADALTLHVDLNETSRGLIGADEMAALPDGAVVVNTSRGAVVDTVALCEALESGRLGGAYVDVLEGEPDPPALERLLEAHPNVLVTPHLAAYDRRTVEDRYRLAADVVRAHGL